jgi:hypothetical protein
LEHAVLIERALDGGVTPVVVPEQVGRVREEVEVPDPYAIIVAAIITVTEAVTVA